MKNRKTEPQGLKIIVLEDKPEAHVTGGGISYGISVNGRNSSRTVKRI